MRTKICPKCGESLIYIKGYDGVNFWGCTNILKCRHIEIKNSHIWDYLGAFFCMLLLLGLAILIKLV